MRKKWQIFLSCICFAFISIAFAKPQEKEKKVKGSISTQGVRPSRFPKLAKISPTEAAQIAKGKTAGDILSVGLENEDGFLIYAVEMADQKSGNHEVLIDAGNGKVLTVEAKNESIDEDNESDSTEND